MAATRQLAKVPRNVLVNLGTVFLVASFALTGHYIGLKSFHPELYVIFVLHVWFNAVSACLLFFALAGWRKFVEIMG